MKILQVINIGYEAGGAEKSVKLIKDELILKGHEVMVLATDLNSKDKQLFADELLPAIDGAAPLRLLRYFWYGAAYRKMKKIIEGFKPDVIHLHTIGEFSPSLVWATGKTPTILTIHGPEEYTLKLLPWVLHPSDYKGLSYKSKDLKISGRLRYIYFRFLQRPAYRLPLKRLKLVIAPSKFMYGDIKSDFPESKIRQLYNGIHLPEAADLPKDNSNKVLYVGRLAQVKGVDHLIRAFAKIHSEVPSARLRIVGNGDILNDLKELTAQLGLTDCIEFPGWIAPKNISREYASSDLLVIPSVWPENLPTVAIEALGTGRPIVGSNIGGISELVDNGKNGNLVKPGDESALAESVISLLNDKELLSRMSKASSAMSSKFDHSLFIEQLLEIYEGAV